MIFIDGSHGEGGGQIVRTALALSVLTGQPFEVSSIRQGRSQSGLKAQHLTAIKALKEICGAKTNEVVLGSDKLRFFPGKVRPGSYNIDIGTAGSISLLLQALLLPLIFSSRKTTLNIIGGTCGKWQAPVDYFQYVFLPFLRRFAKFDFKLLKRGYFPNGGGQVSFSVSPRFKSFQDISGLKPFDLTKRGRLIKINGVSHASSSLQSAQVAERQAQSAQSSLKSLSCSVDIRMEYRDTLSFGSGLTLWALFSEDEDFDFEKPVILGADALGERGKRAELVGQEAAQSLLSEIAFKAPLDSFLADQIVPFLALIPGSQVLIPQVTDHFLSNVYVVEQFLPVKFRIDGNLVSVESLS